MMTIIRAILLSRFVNSCREMMDGMVLLSNAPPSYLPSYLRRSRERRSARLPFHEPTTKATFRRPIRNPEVRTVVQNGPDSELTP